MGSYILADIAIDTGYPDNTVESGYSILDNIDEAIAFAENKLENSNDNLSKDLDEVLNDVSESVAENSEIDSDEPVEGASNVRYFYTPVTQTEISPEIDKKRKEVSEAVDEYVSCSFLGPKCKLSIDLSKIINEVLPALLIQLQQKAKELKDQIAANPAQTLEILLQKKEEVDQIIKSTMKNEAVLSFEKKLKEIDSAISSFDKNKLDEVFSNVLIKKMLYLANLDNTSEGIGQYSEKFMLIAKSIYKVSTREEVIDQLDKHVYKLLKHKDYDTKSIVNLEGQIHSVLYLVNFVGNGAIDNILVDKVLVFLKRTFTNDLFKNFSETEIASIKEAFLITAELIEHNHEIKVEANEMVNLIKEQIEFIKTMFRGNFNNFKLEDLKKIDLIVSRKADTFKKLKELYDNGTVNRIFKSNGQLNDEVVGKSVAVRVVKDSFDGKTIKGNWILMQFETKISETQKLKINFLVNQDDNRIAYDVGYKADILNFD